MIQVTLTYLFSLNEEDYPDIVIDNKILLEEEIKKAVQEEINSYNQATLVECANDFEFERFNFL